MSLKGPVQAQYYVTDFGNGTYQAFYLCQQRGNYKLKVTLNGVNVGVLLQGTEMFASPVGERTVLHLTKCSEFSDFV